MVIKTETYGIIQCSVLSFYIVVNVCCYLEGFNTFKTSLKSHHREITTVPTERKVRSLEWRSSRRWSFWVSYVSSTRSLEDDMMSLLRIGTTSPPEYDGGNRCSRESVKLQCLYAGMRQT